MAPAGRLAPWKFLMLLLMVGRSMPDDGSALLALWVLLVLWVWWVALVLLAWWVPLVLLVWWVPVLLTGLVLPEGCCDRVSSLRFLASS